MESPFGRFDKVAQWLCAFPYYVVSLLLWPLLWGGWAVSVWLAYRWAEVTAGYVLSLSHLEPQALISGLLHIAELLLLIPLPGIVGSVAFRNVRAFSDPKAQERDSAEQEIALAKRLILGILVTVTGTRMLIEFLEGHHDWHIYVNGAVLTLTVAAYIYVLALTHRRR